MAPVTFGASRQELKAIIDSVGTVPRVTAGSADPGGYVSFAFLSTANGITKVFEAIVNDTTGRDLFARLFAALPTNRSGLRKLRAFGCTAVMLPKNTPVNVEAQVTVTFSGLRADRTAKGQFVGKVKVLNHSGLAIPAPVTLVVIRRGGNARLIGEDGFTCNVQPGGSAYLNLNGGSSLGPGGTAEGLLRFANPSMDKFDVDFRVFAGPGTR